MVSRDARSGMVEVSVPPAEARNRAVRARASGYLRAALVMTIEALEFLLMVGLALLALLLWAPE